MVYCFRLNFNISKLVYYRFKSIRYSQILSFIQSLVNKTSYTTVLVNVKYKIGTIPGPIPVKKKIVKMQRFGFRVNSFLIRAEKSNETRAVIAYVNVC